MKKLLFLILTVSASAFADIAVTPGSGKTVHTETLGGVENQIVELVGAGGASTATVVGGFLQVQVQASTTGVVGVVGDNVAAASSNRLPTLSGITYADYENGTAATAGRDSAQSHGTDGLLWTAQQPSFRPAWYSASTNTITTASNPTDITALCGNADNTVIVTGLRISGTQTTAGMVNLAILKRSTRFTGAFSTMTPVAMDSTYAVPHSTAVWFTANPTLGTLVGHVDNYKLGVMATATASPNDIYISPSNWRSRAVVLRGTAECITANLLAGTVTGGAFTVGWDWIETRTISP